MDISEIDLLRKFIEEKNLLSQYQEWRKSYVKDYENVVVKFCCLNGKYEFEITIARKQLDQEHSKQTHQVAIQLLLKQLRDRLMSLMKERDGIFITAVLDGMTLKAKLS